MATFSREECAHIANVLLDYVKHPNHLEETVFVIGRKQVTTKNILAKAVEGSLARDPEEAVTARDALDGLLRAAGVFMNDRQYDRALSELQDHFPDQAEVFAAMGRRHYDDPTQSVFGSTPGQAQLPEPEGKRRKRRITKRRKS